MSSTLKQKELLNTQNSVEQADKENYSSEELIERIPLEGTPFTAIKYKEKYRLVSGKYQISEEIDTLPEVWEYLKKNLWMIIMRLILIITKPTDEITEMVKKHNEEDDQMLGAYTGK